MNILYDIMACAMLFALFGIPLICTVFNIISAVSKRRFKRIWDIITVGFGFLLSWILISSYSGYEYYEQTYIGEPAISEYHKFISGEYTASVFVIAIFAVISLLCISVHKKPLPPALTAIFIGGTLLGNVLAVVITIQILKHIDLMNAFLLLYFFNFFLVSARVITREIKAGVEQIVNNDIIPRHTWTIKLYTLLLKARNWIWVSFLLLLPALAVIYIILLLFGQGPAGIVKAFTETADWTFSQKTPPPPLEYQGHYLCTVAAGGHRKLVKPLRYGERLGEKIIVNRQLMIANAFEELIHDKLPKSHKALRGFYDKHGYPICRFINTPFKADMVYIIMKPLEWLFLAYLYMFDAYPETRIARQYFAPHLYG